mmetsp:Transcript_8731/g.25610  ORF Transcript_8731/g.25610 Transcript_8731/m.25610 type:complete len:278 (+) Transcript_8731:137-970(+)
MAKKLRRLRPPAAQRCRISSFCSCERRAPGSPSRCAKKAASGTCSPAAPASSAKSASIGAPRAWSAVRTAPAAWPRIASERRSKAARAASEAVRALFSRPATCWRSLAMSCFASDQGPLDAFATRGSCAVTDSLASASSAVSASAASVAAFRTVRGAATEPRSASLAEVSGAAVSSNCLSAAWAFSTLPAMVASTREAAFLSFFSSCFLRSISSLLECSRLHSSTFLCSCSTFARMTWTFGLILASSVFASAKGPCLHSLRSALLETMKLDAFTAMF